MKLRITLDGQPALLDLGKSETGTTYNLEGALSAQGEASIIEVSTGVFSLLLGRQSFTVYTSRNQDSLEVWAAGTRHRIAVADLRDRPAGEQPESASGPRELRAQMPGKIVAILVQPGESVRAGQGLIVVEAMKMQNEMKSPKDGTVSTIHVSQGATVSAGAKLLVVE